MVRAFNHYFSGRKVTFFLAETFGIGVACLFGAAALASSIAPKAWAEEGRTQIVALAFLSLGFVVSLQFALYVQDLYDLRIAGKEPSRGSRMLRAAGMTAILMGLAALVIPVRFPPGVLLGAAIGALAGMIAVRTAIKTVVGEPARLLMVGNGVKAHSLSKLLEEHGEDHFQICAMIEPRREGVGDPADPNQPPAETIDEAALRLRARAVVMAIDEPRGAIWVDALLRCRVLGMSVWDAAGFSERALRRIPVTHVRASDFVFSDDFTVSASRRAIKRAVDVLLALTLLFFAAPAMLIVALAIKLDSRGPIFYRQERVGRFGHNYKLWKFRSMRTDAEKSGAVWAKQNDDRVTRIGRFLRKTRIDEIPQVFNVLAGDMSFVGPRPERQVFTEQLKAQIPFYGLREAVKPGITGWAQIRYPYGASVEDAKNKLEYDLYYVKNGSVFLDLAIIFHTVRHVLQARGAR
jgi:sugar transferase (PEP-CTERM system associated)